LILTFDEYKKDMGKAKKCSYLCTFLFGNSITARYGFPFLGSEHEAKFNPLRFNFGKLCKEPLPSLSMLLPTYWSSLYYRFLKIKVDSYAYEVGIPKVI